MTEKAKPDFESGKYLFKFCTFNTNSLQILVNNTLYFSSPRNLNDPLDCRFKVKINKPENFTNETKKMIKESWFYNDELKYKMKELYGASTEKKEEFLRYLIEYLQNIYSGICCFSLTAENNLLWSHYADEAKGMCFVFDKDKLLESIRESNNSKQDLLKDGKIKYRGVRSAKVKLYKRGDIIYSTDHFFAKTSHWREEEEYRIISQIKEDNRFFPMKPLEFNRYRLFDKKSLKYIFVGERMPKTHRDLIENICKNNFQTIKVLPHKFNF